MRVMDRPALPARLRRGATALAAGFLLVACLPLAAPRAAVGAQFPETPRGAESRMAASAQSPTAPPPAAQAPAAQSAEAAGYTLRDRIVAVVDEDPILASDLERVIALKIVEREPGEGDAALRRRVLERLIDNRLRTHEIDRFGLGQVEVERVDRSVAEIRARFASEEEFRRQLAAVDLDLDGLRQLVARQLAVLDYINERLAVRVFVTLDDIQQYYDQVLVPRLRSEGAPVPPIAEVREDIRELLRQQKLNEEIDAWTESLRREADVSLFLAEPQGPLPPVVETIEEP
jgi:parvulin-like peptidyl-prolyl isomerase